jgi:hypothetical protein
VLSIMVTGSFNQCRLRMLLPSGAKVKRVEVDRVQVEYTVERVRRSRYMCVALEGSGPHSVRVRLR